MPTKFNQPLSIDRAVTFGVAKVRIGHADLTDADTSQTFDFNDLAVGSGESPVPAKSLILSGWANVLTAFSGGGNSAVTLKLGDAGDDDELISAVSVFTGAEGLKGKSGTYTNGAYEAAYDPQLIFTTTDGTCAGLTAGLVEVCILYIQIATESFTS